MKTILFVCLFLQCALTFGQDTYKFNGSLEYVTPDGLVVKQGGIRYRLYFRDPDIDKGKVTYNALLDTLNAADLKALLLKKPILAAAGIVKHDFKNLGNISFNRTGRGHTDGDDLKNITLQRLSPDNFAMVTYGRHYKYNRTVATTVFTTVFLAFTNATIAGLIHSDDIYYIVPLKSGLTLLSGDFEELLPARRATKRLPLDAITAISRTYNFRDNYIQDTLNNKIGLRTYYGRRVMPNQYDSLVPIDRFILAYTGKTFDVYNYALKKLRSGIRLIKPQGPYPVAQLLKKNKLETIDAFGNTTIRLSAGYWDGPDTYLCTIVKKEDGYYIQQLFSDEIKLPYTDGVASLFFADGRQQEFERAGATMFIELCARLMTGKYEINYLAHYKCGSQCTPETIAENDKLPKNLDHVEGSGGYFKIEKDGLKGYFPPGTGMRYKKLGNFNRNFARYTLPDGTKGWLDKQGREYPDE